MNNDIHSVRREPLMGGNYIILKTLPGGIVPAKHSRMLFVNNRLRRAWSLKVRNNKPSTNEFAARIIKEVDYKDAIQTRRNGGRR